MVDLVPVIVGSAMKSSQEEAGDGGRIQRQDIGVYYLVERKSGAHFSAVIYPQGPGKTNEVCHLQAHFHHLQMRAGGKKKTVIST